MSRVDRADVIIKTGFAALAIAGLVWWFSSEKKPPIEVPDCKALYEEIAGDKWDAAHARDPALVTVITQKAESTAKLMQELHCE